MKRIIEIAAGCAIFSVILFAQGPFRARNATPPDPATMIANQVARLTALLDLTTDQASQITTILTNTQSSVSSLQTTLSSDRTSLNTAITGNTGATIDSLAAAMGAIQGQILDAQSKAAASIYALLTSTQQTKLATLGGVGMLAGGPGFGPGPGFGGPGGPGQN